MKYSDYTISYKEKKVTHERFGRVGFHIQLSCIRCDVVTISWLALKGLWLVTPGMGELAISPHEPRGLEAVTPLCTRNVPPPLLTTYTEISLFIIRAASSFTLLGCNVKELCESLCWYLWLSAVLSPSDSSSSSSSSSSSPPSSFFFLLLCGGVLYFFISPFKGFRSRI